jgi:RNA polymerase sigma factor (sigma-70 family)
MTVSASIALASGPLSRTTEREAGRLVQLGLQSRARLASGGPCSSNELRQLRRDVRIGEAARDQLFRAHVKTVVRVAKKTCPQWGDLEEVVQEGSMGLLNAIDKFDPDRGTRLASYSSYWIFQSISRAVSRMKPPAAAVGPAGRDPSDGLRYCRMSTVERVERVSTADGGRPSASVAEVDDLINRTVNDALRRLSDLEYEVLYLRLGLGGYPWLRTDEVAKVLNRDLNDVRRAEYRAVFVVFDPDAVESIRELLRESSECDGDLMRTPLRQFADDSDCPACGDVLTQLRYGESVECGLCGEDLRLLA